MEEFRICRLSERALLVTLSDTISEEANDLALRTSLAVEAADIPGVEEAQPAYSSLCVHFDPLKVGAPWLGAFIRERLAALAKQSEKAKIGGTGRVVDIPVKYGGEDGPDLAWASEHLGLPPEEIIRRHAEGRYRVYMIGFAPGFPYLGGMDQSISLPRLPTPRTAVPAGSVAIGGGQAGIYPRESPGGWRIIGRTPVEFFSPHSKTPCLVSPGDTVRFVPVNDIERSPGPESSVDETLASKTHPRAPALLVEHPGLLSIVVDAGRKRYRKLGVPVSGAADANSYTLANILCGNSPSAPALEMTLWGPRLRALMDIVVAVTGAPSPLSVDGFPVPMNKAFLLREGSLLEVGSPNRGCRIYLAASGGFDVPLVMDSASTYLRGAFGGLQGRRLLSGDTLYTRPGAGYNEVCAAAEALRDSPQITASTCLSGLTEWPLYLDRRLSEEILSLRVLPGPESLSPSGQALLSALCSRTYSVRSDSDRMGARFDGPLLEPGQGQGDILSSPVVPGVIQVPSDGRPVLLLSDAQTCGGYRRVATVLGEDLPLAGQMRPGAKIGFQISNV